MNEEEIKQLLRQSSLPAVTIDDFGLDLIDSCINEINSLQSQKLLEESAMGYQTSFWKHSLFRGDKSCWITPELCKIQKLNGVTSLIKRLMKVSASIREYTGDSLALTDYSVQFAIYVGSSILDKFSLTFL
jgi:hypothetical protein